MPFHILWSINLYENRQKRGWPVVVKQRKKEEGTDRQWKESWHLRNGALTSYFKGEMQIWWAFESTTKGRLARLLHLTKSVVFFTMNAGITYLSSDSNSHFDLDFRHALLDAWGKFYLDYYYECVLNMIITELQIFRSSIRMYFVFCLVFCITSGSMNSNCIFVVSIQLRWPPKRSIIHFVPN